MLKLIWREKSKWISLKIVRKPTTNADNVGDNVGGTNTEDIGDNVGDVAGMSADLFGSFAESTCAVLVISSNTLMASGCDFFISNFLPPNPKF